MCEVKGAASDKSTKNLHSALKFPSAPLGILASFSSLFWFTLTALINLVSSSNRQLFSAKKL